MPDMSATGTVPHSTISEGVSQKGEEQLARICDIVNEPVGSVVTPLHVYAPALAIDMPNAIEPKYPCTRCEVQFKKRLLSQHR